MSYINFAGDCLIRLFIESPASFSAAFFQFKPTRPSISSFIFSNSEIVALNSSGIFRMKKFSRITFRLRRKKLLREDANSHYDGRR